MLLIGAACIILYFVNPVEAVWMPKCTFYVLTGFKCPACGGLRSVHALMHGHFYEAWMYNPMAIATIPLAAIIIWRSLKDRARAKAHPNAPEGAQEAAKYADVTRRWVYAYIIVFMAWWVIRNIIHV